TQGGKRRVTGTRVQADEGWTKRGNRGTTASPQTDHHPNSVPPDDDTTLGRLECLQADRCRSLGPIPARPSALSDTLLRYPGGQDAGGWQRGKDGLCRIPLPALWPGQALGGDELAIVVVPAGCESLRGQLGQPGEQSSPRGRDVSAHHPDGPRDGPHDFLPQRRGLVACGD